MSASGVDSVSTHNALRISDGVGESDVSTSFSFFFSSRGTTRRARRTSRRRAQPGTSARRRSSRTTRSRRPPLSSRRSPRATRRRGTAPACSRQTGTARGKKARKETTPARFHPPRFCFRHWRFSSLSSSRLASRTEKRAARLRCPSRLVRVAETLSRAKTRRTANSFSRGRRFSSSSSSPRVAVAPRSRNRRGASRGADPKASSREEVFF
mmetsp:Transcript_12530/g.52529  ORF Transcript_12530/g.52529 Transcript_12530/m.52529 type:complete len:211 (-) Transcript_12530:1274-1906(-)